MVNTFARKILLTSAGFETQAISDAFLSFVSKNPESIKVLFIPTAAIFYDALKMVPSCMNDLLNIGIPEVNIKVFDLHRTLSTIEMSVFDAVYFTGGSPQYLLERINDTGFNNTLSDFINKGGIYVGVSAGAVIGAGNIPNNLGFLNAVLSVHTQDSFQDGIFDNNTVTHINLSNDKAIMINGDIYKII